MFECEGAEPGPGGVAVTHTDLVVGQRVIALDGKTIRRARGATSDAPQLVAAFDNAAGGVPGQSAVTAKSREVPRVRK